jgi:hypothetical protein
VLLLQSTGTLKHALTLHHNAGPGHMRSNMHVKEDLPSWKLRSGQPAEVQPQP